MDKPSIKTGTCNSLDEVRACIDVIDSQIVALLAARSTFVAQAAHFKLNAGEVLAPKRVEDVVARVRQKALSVGLDPSIAESAYRAMIAAFIDWEMRRHSELATAKSGFTT